MNVNYIILYCKIRSLLMILLSQSWIKGTRCVHQFQTCSLRTLFFILSILNIFETQWLFNVNLSSRYMYTDIIQSDLLLFLLNPTLKTFNNAYSNSSMVDKKNIIVINIKKNNHILCNIHMYQLYSQEIYIKCAIWNTNV